MHTLSTAVTVQVAWSLQPLQEAQDYPVGTYGYISKILNQKNLPSHKYEIAFLIFNCN